MAHFMLEEVGAPYRIVHVDFEKGENRTPEFLAINPMGKLPTIVHRGVTVTETGAIIAYLADAFPQAGLAPAIDDPARGTWLRWILFGAGVYENDPSEFSVSVPLEGPLTSSAVSGKSCGSKSLSLSKLVPGMGKAPALGRNTAPSCR